MQTTNSPSNSSSASFQQLPTKTKWILVICAVYLALPIDVIPGVGLIGDMSAFLVSVNAVLNALAARKEA